MSDSNNVLVLTSSYPRATGDNAGHFVAAEVEKLIDEGHRVTVLAGGVASTDSPRRTRESVRFVGGGALFDHPGVLPRLRQNPFRALCLLSSSARVFAQRTERRVAPIDRAIAHWLFPAAVPWGILLVPRQTPLEIVVHGSDLGLLLSAPVAVRVWLLEKLATRNVSLRLVSAEQKRRLLDQPLGPASRDLVEEATIQPATLRLPTVGSKRACRKRLGISQKERLVLIVARLIPEKRVDIALRASELIPNAQVVVIGEGPWESQLRSDFAHARFLGAQARQEVIRWMRAADILLHASRKEGAPTVIREASALGTSVVSVNCGDVQSWAEQNRHIWVID